MKTWLYESEIGKIVFEGEEFEYKMVVEKHDDDHFPYNMIQIDLVSGVPDNQTPCQAYSTLAEAVAAADTAAATGRW